MRRMLFVFAMLLILVAPLSAQEIYPDDLTELLEDYVFDDEPSVVLYVDTGDEAWIGVAGLADLDNETPADTDDLYRIGSITKPMTATIILQLVDEGVIDLDAPMSDYLPDSLDIDRVENADIATVRQMLQMTSGIFSYTDSDAFDDAVFDNPSTMWTALDTIEFIYDEPADFEPGEDYVYSNSNYNLAELMVEAQTGDSLAIAFEDRIFEPLDMDSCYMETPDVFAENIVRGYADYGDGFEDVTDINDGVGMGDGGVVCTAEDLAKFPRALWNGELLSDDTLDEMLDTVTDDWGGEYGLGIAYEENELGYMQLGHDGSTSGFQSNMAYLPEEDVVVVVLTNNFDSEIVFDLTLDAQAIVLDY
ncbi:MAG: serine hydrolase domain-containing protein [Chloroflexota bacterium]